MFADTGAWGSMPYCTSGPRVAQRQQWGPDADRLLFWVRPNPDLACWLGLGLGLGLDLYV